MTTTRDIAITDISRFSFGHAPKPVKCGRGVEIGCGTVVPEINFTLPSMDIEEENWTKVRQQYDTMVQGVLRRATELHVPALLVEFETLPPMTVRPDWGLEICRLLVDRLEEAHSKHGLRSALRLTPNDSREFNRPPLMRRGEYWDGMVRMFDEAAGSGADLLAIESTGGKEVCDEALINGDLRTVVFALGVLGARDMEFLWKKIVASCKAQNIIPSGDTACGFANTAMVLADQKMIPRVFAAVVRVLSVPRSLVAYEMGALGPSKDCAYEGPYMKAIAGVPISMEGRSSACAHLSPVGNVSQAVCDCWSNESVQNVRLLSDYAPTVSMEQLAYDCRLMSAASHTPEDAARLRDWLADSDASLDPQAWVLRPDTVLRISRKIVQAGDDPYLRTRAAAHAAIEDIRRANDEGRLALSEREEPWLDMMETQLEDLPGTAEELLEEILAETPEPKFLPEEYGF